MMTKRESALQVLNVARMIHDSLAGDDDADVWVASLLWIAEKLDRTIIRHHVYERIVMSDGESRQVKLRRLIEHPSTGDAERRAAIAALDRIKAVA